MSLKKEIVRLIEELGTEITFSNLFARVVEKFPDADKKECKKIVAKTIASQGKDRDQSPTRSKEGAGWQLDSKKLPFCEVIQANLQLEKNLRVAINRFNNQIYVDIRKWNGANPTPKGISLNAKQWTALLQVSTLFDSRSVSMT